MITRVMGVVLLVVILTACYVIPTGDKQVAGYVILGLILLGVLAPIAWALRLIIYGDEA